MPPFGPVDRRTLVRALRRLGFSGPYSGGKHQFMERDGNTVVIPNPHGATYSTGLLVRLLRQAGVSREEWEST